MGVLEHCCGQEDQLGYWGCLATAAVKAHHGEKPGNV